MSNLIFSVAKYPKMPNENGFDLKPRLTYIQEPLLYILKQIYNPYFFKDSMFVQKLCAFAIIPLCIIHAGERPSYASVVKGYRSALQPMSTPQIAPSPRFEIAASDKATFDPQTLFNQIPTTQDPDMRNKLAGQLTEAHCPNTPDEKASALRCVKAWKYTAQTYKQHNNSGALLVSLCNMFVLRYHYDLPQKSSSVKDLCEALASGDIRDYETTYRNDIEKNQDILPELISEGLKLNIPHAIYLHARALHKKNDIDGALSTFASIDAELATDLCHKTGDDELARLFWDNEFKQQSGDKKWFASWQLYVQLHATAPGRADVHLHLAASNRCLPAIEEAYIRGKEESDPAKAFKHFEQAAKGGHAHAQEKCAEYYNQIALSTASEIEKTRADGLAKSYLEAAASSRPTARLKLAFFPNELDVVIPKLTALAEDRKFPLQAEALGFLGETYHRIGMSLDDLNQRQEYLTKAKVAYNKALAKKEKSAARSLALLAVDELTVASQKSLKSACINAGRLLNVELAKMPDDSELLLALANLTIKHNDPTVSHALILKAFEKNPKSPEVLASLNAIFTWLADRKQFSRINELAESLLELDPSYALPYIFLGSMHQQRNSKLAYIYYHIAAELGSSAGHHALSIIYFDEDNTGTLDLKKALFHAEQALKQNPSDGALLYRLARTQFALKQEEAAILTLSKGIRMGNSADCCALLANHSQRDTFLPEHLSRASALYKRAAQLARAPMQKKAYEELSEIALLQDFVFPQAADVKKTFANLCMLINSTKYPGVASEARLALAVQYSLAATNRAMRMLAIKQLDILLREAPNHRAAFLKAKILLDMLMDNTLDETNSSDAELTAMIQPLFTSIIKALEQEAGRKAMLISCYNHLGTYLVEKSSTPEEAIALFIKGASLNSVESCLKLSKYYKQQQNSGQALLWANQAYRLNPFDIGLDHIKKMLGIADLDAVFGEKNATASSTPEATVSADDTNTPADIARIDSLKPQDDRIKPIEHVTTPSSAAKAKPAEPINEPASSLLNVSACSSGSNAKPAKRIMGSSNR